LDEEAVKVCPLLINLHCDTLLSGRVSKAKGGVGKNQDLSKISMFRCDGSECCGDPASIILMIIAKNDGLSLIAFERSTELGSSHPPPRLLP